MAGSLTIAILPLVGLGDRILITRNGRPSFVLVSPDELEALEETLEILRDADLTESIRRSREDAAAGRTTRLERPERNA